MLNGGDDVSTMLSYTDTWINDANVYEMMCGLMYPSIVSCSSVDDDCSAVLDSLLMMRWSISQYGIECIA